MKKVTVETNYEIEREKLIGDIRQQIKELNDIVALLEKGYTISEYEVDALNAASRRRFVAFKAKEQLLSWYDEIAGE